MESNHIIEKSILGDGNCLFRSFSYFLYSDEGKHRQIRLRIVYNVHKNWPVYEPFIIGDESYGTQIIDRTSYKLCMSKDGAFGGEVELQCFVDIYNVHILVYVNDSEIPREFGQNCSNSKLILLLNGVIDMGHYDVIECLNSTFWYDYKSHCNRRYHNTNKDIINEKRRVENLTGVEVLKKRYFNKIENMTVDRLEKKRKKDMVENMTEERLEKKRKNDMVYMTHDRLEKKRVKDMTQNMTEQRLKTKREKDVVLNMEEERLHKKREKDTVENMREERVIRKREKDVVQNMEEKRLNKKREKDTVRNMREERVIRKREKDVVRNMEQERLNKKRENNVVQNMKEERVMKKRKTDMVQNMEEERLMKKRENDIVRNMNMDRLIKKRLSNIANNMTYKRINKRRRIQQVIKMCPNQMSYVDLGDMDYVCSHCGASFWSAEFSKKSCCHNGKVKLSPLSNYNPTLKNLLLHDRRFRELIRYYNSRFSFATFNANVTNEFKKGVYNLKIQGQVCHMTPNSICTKTGDTPNCGQIYIYDDFRATEERLKENKNLVEEHIKIISTILNILNPYAKKYKHLFELTKDKHMPEYYLYFVRNITLDKNRYNTPTTAECAALIVSKDGEIPSCFDLCIYPKNLPRGVDPQSCLNKLSFHIDPMIFPIMFPCGDLGWSPLFKQNHNSDKRLSALQYYSYRLAYRQNTMFDPILFCGRVTQQYVIQAYIIIQSNRLNFLRYNQKKLRIECYQGLVDHVARSALNDSKNFENKERLGNIFVLPSTYSGSPRNMQQNYQDAMAIVRSIGRPDLFITMTCNPNWPELKRILKKFPPGTTCNDIPNITVRLFHLKFRALLADVISGKFFGNILAYVYTIEFQKRGLPHAHMLFVLDYKNKLITPEAIDKYISAEICSYDQELQDLIIKHMLHGPHTQYSPCYNIETNICSKKFPKDFCNSTRFEKNGFPIYRRRDNRDQGFVYNQKINGNFVKVDDSMTVPHNTCLLKKYKCHINVEYCASIMSTKYIYKYLHKGHDRAYFKLKKKSEALQEDTYDEISEYVDSRYVSPMEAAWRIEELPLSGRSHTIVRLAVHTENQQQIIFEEDNEERALVNHNTTLTAWFNLNKQDKNATKFMYANIPKHYLYDSLKKTWIKRKTFSKAIGRVVNVSPKDVERFHLKLLLNRVKGATCFNDLKTYEDIIYKSFKETALAMGLIDGDVEIFNIFNEACSIMMPVQLRKFFSWFLIAEYSSFSSEIWNKYKSYFCEGFSKDNEYNALQEISDVLSLENMKCSDFGLPEPTKCSKYHQTVKDKKIFIMENKKKYIELSTQLNTDQASIFNNITKTNKHMIFIDGPGGTGKTFLYKTLIHYYLGEGKKVISMAWTGIASILLPGGMTSHKTFRLPLDLTNIETSFLKLKSDKKKLQECDIIIWDEASMIPKKALDIVDRTLRDCCNIDNIPFAGKLIILGGDFRQILPVLKYGTRYSIIKETIKFSNLWKEFQIFKLNKNMRSSDDNFSSFLLKIGSGSIQTLTIPINWLTDDICAKIYGLVINKNEDLSNRAILACHNDDIYKLNDRILKKIHEEEKIYYSIDYAKHKGLDQTDNDVTLSYPIEYLNSLRFPGLPVHKLVLKIGTIIMLIRNLSINDGLCNGTRLKIINLFKFNLEVKIITGNNIGNNAFIPKILLDTGELSSLPFVLYRRQFPVVLAFAITINKSQGQSFEKVGLYINRPLFSHGQLYVALSRCQNPNTLYIENRSENVEEIENIVWKEVFDR